MDSTGFSGARRVSQKEARSIAMRRSAPNGASAAARRAARALAPARTGFFITAPR
jgi:hypothetical protein